MTIVTVKYSRCKQNIQIRKNCTCNIKVVMLDKGNVDASHTQHLIH